MIPEADFEPPAATTLPSGLTVVSARSASAASASAGFWIGVGSADEPASSAGMSHFLEHVAFLRGTTARSPAAITRELDDMGAVAGASTSSENTVFAAHCLAETFPAVFSLLAEIVQEPAFEGVELERNRILDELAGYEDDDAEALDLLFQHALYGDHPLARRTLGATDTVQAIDAAALRAWHERAYVAGNVVLAAAGPLDHDDLVHRAESLWHRPGDPPPPREHPAPRPPTVAFERRDIGQFQLLLGARAPGEADAGFHALWLLVEALGAAASSRLWERLGEQLGLVYAVGCEQAGTAREGQALVSVAMRPGDLPRTLAEIRRELDGLAERPPDAAELRRARAVARAELLLDPRSPADEQERIGRRASSALPAASLEDELAALDAVTLDDMHAAAGVFDPAALTIAAVGPDERAFRAAVEAAFGRDGSEQRPR